MEKAFRCSWANHPPESMQLGLQPKKFHDIIKFSITRRVSNRIDVHYSKMDKSGQNVKLSDDSS